MYILYVITFKRNKERFPITRERILKSTLTYEYLTLSLQNQNVNIRNILIKL